MARLIGGLHCQQLHHLTEMRVELSNKAAGHNQRGSLILDKVRHDLHHSLFHFIGQIELCIPGNCGGRIPLRGRGLRIQTNCIG